MVVFALNTNELSLLNCFHKESVSLKESIPLNAERDNFIVFVVDKKVALLSKITEVIIEKDFFAYRLETLHILKPENRMPFIFNAPSNKHSAFPLHSEFCSELIASIYKSEQNIHFYLTNIEDLLHSEKTKVEKQKFKTQNRPPLNKNLLDEKINYKNMTEPHLKAQFILKELADIVGYDGFIAKNDQNRVYNSKILSENSLVDIPKYHISKDLDRHISLIDVLWFQNDIPKACFEVETSTSVYSGLLRMADFVCTTKNTQTELYIVTTKNRKEKIQKELNRPIFKQIGLSQICKVIFIEELEVLYSLVSNLKGHVKENILEKISYDFYDFQTIKAHPIG